MLDGNKAIAALKDSPWGPRLDAVVAALKAPTALVGGFVRDALLGATPKDLDLVTEGAPEGAISTLLRSNRSWLGLPLDAKRGYWRLVFPGGAHMDLAHAEGACLRTDLMRRDFTANAMAIAWPSGQLIDPTGGLADLQARCLRLPRPDAFLSDPLRVLRAWRFAASLGFTLAPETLLALHHASPRLVNVAGERMWVELALWFAVPGLPHLDALQDAGIWTNLGLGHHPSSEGVARAQALRQAFSTPWWSALETPLVGGRSRRSVLVASALAGNPAGLRAMAERLRWGKQEGQWAQLAWSGAAFFQSLGPTPGPRALHRLLAISQEALPGALALSQAGIASAWPVPPKPTEGPWQKDLDALTAAWSWAKQRQENPIQKLVDGREVMAWAGLLPGPEVARWMAELQEAQAIGDVKDRTQAEAWVRAKSSMS